MTAKNVRLAPKHTCHVVDLDAWRARADDAHRKGANPMLAPGAFAAFRLLLQLDEEARS